MKFIIRFKGGSGGNFLKSQLYQYTNSLDNFDSNNNGYFFRDVPFKIFLKYTIPFDVCDKYNIPHETQWYQLEQLQAETIIKDILKTTTNSILAMHLVFKNNFNHDKVFGAYELIDIYPSAEGFWKTQALQFYKSGFVKEYELPKTYRENDDRVSVMVNHHKQHGWFPSYWGWIAEGPVTDRLDDVQGFIEKYGNSQKWQQKLNELHYTGREFIVQGDRFVFDRDAIIYKNICEYYNLTPNKQTLENIYNYACGNIEVFKRLGLFKKINSPLNHTQQIDLLKQTFLPIIESLPSSHS